MLKILAKTFLLLILLFLVCAPQAQAYFNISPKIVTIDMMSGDIFKQIFVINSDSKNTQFRAVSPFANSPWIANWRILSSEGNATILEVTILAPLGLMNGSYNFDLDISDALSEDKYRVGFTVNTIDGKTDIEEFSCSDSDKGKNIMIFGVTRNSAGWNEEDVCINNVTLSEFYCEKETGKVLSDDFKCKEGCQDGKCVDVNALPLETANKIKKNDIVSDKNINLINSKKKTKTERSFTILYFYIFLAFLGAIVTKYVKSVQKIDGGVGLLQRIIGPFMIFGAIFSIIIFLSIDGSLFLVFAFIIFVIKILIATNKNINELYTAKMKNKYRGGSSKGKIKTKYYNK